MKGGNINSNSPVLTEEDCLVALLKLDEIFTVFGISNEFSDFLLTIKLTEYFKKYPHDFEIIQEIMINDVKRIYERVILELKGPKIMQMLEDPQTLNMLKPFLPQPLQQMPMPTNALGSIATKLLPFATHIPLLNQLTDPKLILSIIAKQMFQYPDISAFEKLHALITSLRSLSNIDNLANFDFSSSPFLAASSQNLEENDLELTEALRLSKEMAQPSSTSFSSLSSSNAPINNTSNTAKHPRAFSSSNNSSSINVPTKLFEDEQIEEAIRRSLQEQKELEEAIKASLENPSPSIIVQAKNKRERQYGSEEDDIHDSDNDEHQRAKSVGNI